MAKRTRQTREQELGLPELNYDWYLLGNAEVAAQYLQQGKEGVPLAKKGLELILEDIGSQAPWIVNTVTDERVLPLTFQNQLADYKRYRDVQTVGDLIGRYKGDLEKYLGKEGVEVALGELDEFAEMRYSQVNDKMGELNHIIEGKKYGRSTETEVKKAKNQLEKYAKVKQTFNLLEGLYHGRFRIRLEGKAMEEGTREALREMYMPSEE